MITIIIWYSKHMPRTTIMIDHTKDWDSISKYRGYQGRKMGPSKGEMFWEVLPTITIDVLPLMKMPMDCIFTNYKIENYNIFGFWRDLFLMAHNRYCGAGFATLLLCRRLNCVNKYPKPRRTICWLFGFDGYRVQLYNPYTFTITAVGMFFCIYNIKHTL